MPKKHKKEQKMTRFCRQACGPNLSKQVAGLGCMGRGDEQPPGEDGHEVGHGGAVPQQAMVAHVQFLQPCRLPWPRHLVHCVHFTPMTCHTQHTHHYQALGHSCAVNDVRSNNNNGFVGCLTDQRI